MAAYAHWRRLLSLCKQLLRAWHAFGFLLANWQFSWLSFWYALLLAMLCFFAA
jgi:hypothetical protein